MTTGQTIESRAAPPIGRGLALLLAVGLAGLAIALRSPVPGLLAVLPLALAATFHLGQPRFFRAVAEEDGLRIEGRDGLLRYDDIQGLKAARPSNPYRNGPRRYSIRLITSEGDVVIPRHLNVACDALYLFLFQHLSSSGKSPVHPSLADYHDAKRKRHGGGRVWAFRARKRIANPDPRVILTGLAMSATGGVWVFAGSLLRQEAWISLGAAFVFFGMLIAFLGWKFQSYAKAPLMGRSKEPAGLVISPEGLALVQGPLDGQIRWREVRSIKIRAGILFLYVEGAEIPIPDVYDRPMAVIHQLVSDYWNSRDESDRPEWRFDASRFLEAAREEDRDKFTDGR